MAPDSELLFSRGFFVRWAFPRLPASGLDFSSSELFFFQRILKGDVSGSRSGALFFVTLGMFFSAFPEHVFPLMCLNPSFPQVRRTPHCVGHLLTGLRFFLPLSAHGVEARFEGYPLRLNPFYLARGPGIIFSSCCIPHRKTGPNSSSGMDPLKSPQLVLPYFTFSIGAGAFFRPFTSAADHFPRVPIPYELRP